MVLAGNSFRMDNTLDTITKQKRTVLLTMLLALPSILFTGGLVTSGGCSPDGCPASAYLATSDPVLFLLLGTFLLVIAYGLAVSIIFGASKVRSRMLETRFDSSDSPGAYSLCIHQALASSSKTPHPASDPAATIPPPHNKPEKLPITYTTSLGTV